MGSVSLRPWTYRREPAGFLQGAVRGHGCAGRAGRWEMRLSNPALLHARPVWLTGNRCRAFSGRWIEAEHGGLIDRDPFSLSRSLWNDRCFSSANQQLATSFVPAVRWGIVLWLGRLTELGGRWALGSAP